MSTPYKKLRNRFYQLWACIVVAMLLPLWGITFGFAIAFFVVITAFVLFGFFFFTATCPRCTSIILGRNAALNSAAGLPIFGPPLSIPKRCPCCGYDLETNAA
jgi:hypothetical protein